MTDSPLSLAVAADWVRRRLIWLLVASYLLAAFAPGPGVWLRDLDLRQALLGALADPEGQATEATPVRFSLVLVGVLLLAGAVSIDVAKLGEVLRRPGALCLALCGVWLPPVVLVLAWNAVAPVWLDPGDAAALGLGLALTGAMPVANSAVAWTQQSEGSLVWALGLVVLSISICPWLAPQLLWLMGLTLSASDAAAADALVARFTGAVFIVWVLGPTLLGFLLRAVAGGRRISHWRPGLTLVSAGALLLLNYSNAATVLPRIAAEPRLPLLATTLVATVSLPLTGLAAAWFLAPWARLSRRSRVAWSYGLSMKNTGLALGLAGAALGDHPVAVLAILVATLTQHAVASYAHASSDHRDDHRGEEPAAAA